jgi:hypothetical protein
MACDPQMKDWKNIPHYAIRGKANDWQRGKEFDETTFYLYWTIVLSFLLVLGIYSCTWFTFPYIGYILPNELIIYPSIDLIIVLSIDIKCENIEFIIILSSL